MFNWLFGPKLLEHKPATGWMVKPADYKGRHCVTAFWEDSPDRCYDCGTRTETSHSDPLMIEGEIQYMKVTRFCPNNCGRTDWIA